MSGKAHAECSGNGCTGTVTGIYTYEDAGNDILIATSGTETLLSNCVPESAIYIHLKVVRAALGVNENLHQELYQTLLAAELSGRPVKIRTKDTPGATCEIEYVVLN